MENKSIIKTWGFYMWCFFACCVLGWVYENFWILHNTGHFGNPGFLNGCYLPVYGFGGLVLIFGLKKITEKKVRLGRVNVMPIIMFVIILILVSTVEYIASLIMEYVFHVKLWDYSEDFINIYGRVSLRNSSFLAALGFTFVFGIYPAMKKICSKVKPRVICTVAVLMASIIAVDFVIVIFTEYL